MVADTPWIKCLIITRLNFGSTVQVGPLLKTQAVTNPLVAAFSFASNTNLSQLISADNGGRLILDLCVLCLPEDNPILRNCE